MAGLMLPLAGCGGGGASDSGSEGVSLTIWADDTRALEKDAHTEDVPTHVEGTKFVAAFAPPLPGQGRRPGRGGGRHRAHALLRPDTGDAIRS